MCSSDLAVGQEALESVSRDLPRSISWSVMVSEGSMFIGYNPLWYKLNIWVISAVLCGIAGALYVPQVGIINPSEMSPANSIEIAIWVAVGGRGTLIGPVIGAFAVSLAKSWFTVSFPEYWLFFLGLLFIVVTLMLPQGLVGLWKKLMARKGAAA